MIEEARSDLRINLVRHQLALTEVIRTMHLLEAEDGAQKGKAKPVLNPAAWMSPTTVAGAGEFRVMERRRRAFGTVELSAVAMAARVSSALRATATAGPWPASGGAACRTRPASRRRRRFGAPST